MRLGPTTLLSGNSEGCVGKTVIIKLRGNKSVKGKLLDFDRYTNLVILDVVKFLKDNDNGSKSAIANWGLFFLEQIKCLLLLSHLLFELKLLIDILTDTVSDNSCQKSISCQWDTVLL
jgi:small nuclear ribonucleoprotein (snRNP)-like protein